MFQSGSEGRAAQQCAVLTRLISPVLMNVALHGLEQPARTRYFATTARTPAIGSVNPCGGEVRR